MTEPADRPGPKPVFQQESTYRQRRLQEAARVAPVLALCLWLVPLFWPQTGDGRISSASALIYIFVVWGGVILLTWGLSIAIGRGQDKDEGGAE